MKLKTSFLLIFFSFLIALDTVSAQICSNQYFKPNTTYDLNRRLILSSLTSNVTTHNGFFNSSMGQDPNEIFIIGMCIPGTKPDTCSDCIKDASDSLLQSCPNQTEAYTWPDSCMVRYTNTYFSGELVREPSEVSVNNNTGDIINSNVTVFDIIGEDLISRTVTAAPGRGHKYYAADVASSTDLQTMYAMMQCTPDVNPGFCGLCLRANLDDYKSCCRDKRGGSIVSPSCFIRWDLRPFAGAFENITLPPPSLTPPVRDSANTTGKGKTLSYDDVLTRICRDLNY